MILTHENALSNVMGIASPTSYTINNNNQQLVEAYRQYADALFRYCLFKTSDRELANDLLQETFVRAWQYLVTHGEIDNYKPFLYKIMTNLVIDEYRKRKPIDSLETMRERDGFDPGVEHLESWIDSIDGAQAIALLRNMPSPYNESIFMRYVQELSLLEIAEITGERENTIAVRIRRGLEKLRALFYNEK